MELYNAQSKTHFLVLKDATGFVVGHHIYTYIWFQDIMVADKMGLTKWYEQNGLWTKWY